MSTPAIRQLRDAVRTSLHARADAARAEGMRAYLKSAMPCLGVTMPAIVAECRTVYASHTLPTRDAWCAAVRTLWHEATYREERYAAILLARHRQYDAHQRLVVLPLYRELIVSGAWWDLVDPIATERLPVLLARDRARMSTQMRAWARGADLWLRRSAIICQLKCRGDTDLGLLYDCIEPSIERSEFFLRKAIGWALREHAKTDAAEVLRYVRAQRSRLSVLSKREALKARLRDGSLRDVP